MVIVFGTGLIKVIGRTYLTKNIIAENPKEFILLMMLDAE